jgi:hypothetical protein
MIEIGLSLGLIIAGIAWFIRDLPGILSAPRTATIRSKSYGAPLLRREDDPERFDRLVAYRRKQLVWPALMLAGGVVLLALVILGIARMAATAG